MVRQALLWAMNWLGINEAGHPRGLMTCSQYGHHKHLPLDLIKWELTD